jgi:hypothetical protein
MPSMLVGPPPRVQPGERAAHGCARHRWGGRLADSTAAARPALRRGRQTMPRHRIFDTSFASIYPHYVAKAERKNHSKEEVDRVICWLTGYDEAGLDRVLADEVTLEAFFEQAPQLNPNASLITGTICGYRVQEIEDPLMQKIRYMDLLVDEVARGKKMTSILRSSPANA